MRIAIFLMLLTAALGYAAWKGGGPERSMAAILATMLLLDQAMHLILPVNFTIVDMGHLAIDFAAAAATIMIALTAHRFWPMIAAVLQILPLVAHVSRAIDFNMHPAAYLTMQVGASWLLPPLLLFATWRHQKRLLRSGSDRSWRISWQRSSPSLPKT
jgi:hypothetical protein